jgi:hypothetical protein
MTETPVDLLVQSIDRLELENRRFRRAATAIALSVAAIFLMGQTVRTSWGWKRMGRRSWP